MMAPVAAKASHPPRSHTLTTPLGDLTFAHKNTKKQPLLPANVKIQKRPINRAPIASPYAGASVQKIVYVNAHTPLMAAVKRVKKLLGHIEKRAMQNVDVTRQGGAKRLAEASEKLGKSGEAVVVKASGRAIGQALKVGEWFKSREDEVLCRVEVKTGSVCVVDDLVEVDEPPKLEEQQTVGECVEKEADKENMQSSASRDTGHDTTLTLPSSMFQQSSAQEPITTQPIAASTNLEEGGISTNDGNIPPSAESDPMIPWSASNEGDVEEGSRTGDQPIKKRKPRHKDKKAKRTKYDIDDLPEARTRWISTVEVSISLKG